MAEFVGQELISSVARLDASQLMGAWEGGSPSDVRRRGRFRQLLFREDDLHRHHEFCQLMTGRCCLSFRHQTSELEPGDMVALAGGVPHAETICKSTVGYRLAWWVLSDDDPMLHVHRYRRKTGYDVEHVIRLTSLSSYGKGRLDVLRELAAGSVRERPAVEALREAMLSVAVELYRQILKGGENSVRRPRRVDPQHHGFCAGSFWIAAGPCGRGEGDSHVAQLPDVTVPFPDGGVSRAVHKDRADRAGSAHASQARLEREIGRP